MSIGVANYNFRGISIVRVTDKDSISVNLEVN